MISDNLQKNLLNTNNKKFWRCWQGYFKNNETHKKINVDGFNESFEIANHLAIYLINYDSFGKTTPIPKFKGCKKNVSADDFRGITICPIL